jgi:hypothetical protein
MRLLILGAKELIIEKEVFDTQLYYLMLNPLQVVCTGVLVFVLEVSAK